MFHIQEGSSELNWIQEFQQILKDIFVESLIKSYEKELQRYDEMIKKK